MKVRDMIKENNRLREKMTPANRSFFEDMILALRASRVDAVRTEEMLLEAADKLLRAQAKGRTAKQIFGSDPEEYFREAIDSAPARPKRGKIQHYAMISWSALTLLLGLQGIAGMITVWSQGTAGTFGTISLFTIIAAAFGSIVFMELLMKWLASLSEDDAPRMSGFNIKALGIYIGAAVAVVFAGLFLRGLFPVFTLPPWISLLIFACGLIGLRLIFFRK
ncbi:putative membrane-anchored protein [Paenibacillus forsythiae]|uniref:Membrane-anchored protein n=1 Tax=Paenibacillus forsythiae TaxID=365616 RepID=A0ABU3HAF3_9BACL|nr:DUF1129 family protein [Paenibacillus forsythiae]MDT3427812.1 putative membrane-anchored protein [Paenibacillus forsythiae]